MNILSYEKQIDIRNRSYQILIVTPKNKLIEWLTAHAKHKGIDLWRLYNSEDDMVVIIPAFDACEDYTIVEEFLNALKPKLLHAELLRFLATPEDLGEPITAESFDKYFDIALRGPAYCLSDFK
jgi:hypothetical protein